MGEHPPGRGIEESRRTLEERLRDRVMGGRGEEIPNYRSYIISNHQIQDESVLAIENLEIRICLEFGYSDLGFMAKNFRYIRC